MGIFVDKDSTFEIEILYVFDKKGKVHVITEEDAEYISKAKEEKESVFADYDSCLLTSIPFNEKIDSIMSYSSEDVRKMTVTLRRMNFNDSSILLSKLGSRGGELSTSDMYEYANKRLSLLFKHGYAEDETGKKNKIDKSNLGDLAPCLGNAISLKIEEVM